jgi:hypothetical protein
MLSEFNSRICLTSNHPKNESRIHFFALPDLWTPILNKRRKRAILSDYKGFGSLFAPGDFNAGITLALYTVATNHLRCGNINTKFGNSVERGQTT